VGVGVVTHTIAALAILATLPLLAFPTGLYSAIDSHNCAESLGKTPLSSTLTLKLISIDCYRVSKSLNKILEKLGIGSF
jgi:hypothetical protein